MDILTYEFEELPLVVEGGFEAGLVNGSAEIRVYDDGAWFVGSIYLDGFKGREQKPIEIYGRTSGLFLAIWEQLTEGRFKDFIQAKVDAAREADGVTFRSDRSEHSTHHAALSGAV
jgi:hypothetical protein